MAASTPIVITTISDLQAIQNDPSGNYVLGANIDASGFNASITNFSGVLDGQGHSIDNLHIALFSNIEAEGVVQDVYLTNVHLFDAALASGTNNGTILNSSVSGAILGHGLTGFAAGLVVQNGSTGTISNSYATCSITGNFNTATVAGLVGRNYGTITDSYATGGVGGSNGATGGLVGSNEIGGTISNSYATGPVTGRTAGGLVGTNSGTVADSYATGLITSTFDGHFPGGLVGLSFQGSVTTSYWDVETSGTSLSAGGVGLTTAQLESGVLPDGFDPTIWFATAGQSPQLLWNGPDLEIVIDSLTSATPSVSAGISLSAMVSNAGGTDAGQFQTRFILSNDMTPDGSDRVLTTFPTAALGAGGTTTFGQSVLIPSNVEDGPWFLGVWADYNNQISEPNNNNNAFFIPINIGDGGSFAINDTFTDDDGLTFPFSIRRYDNDGGAIDNTLPTWVIIHGWNSSPTEFEDVAATIKQKELEPNGYQVLMLDWRTAAASSIFDPDIVENRIPHVAERAAQLLTDQGFLGDQLNFIGHSFGSYIAGEIAERIAGGVNTIVALDPATGFSGFPFFAGGYDSENSNGVDFAKYSNFSWAFHDGDAGNFGSEKTPGTADEAFVVKGGSHTSIDELFINLLNGNSVLGFPTQYFALDRLLSQASVASPTDRSAPWALDRYNAVGSLVPNEPYEAVISTASEVTPQAIDFIHIHTPHDFNGDGRSDILFRQIGQNFDSNFEWQMNDRTLSSQGPIDLFGKEFSVQVIGDFNGDSRSDVLFQNPTTGGVWQWQLNGTAITAQGAVDVGDTSFDLLGTGDFNGDGKDDVLFRNDTTGFVFMWQMDGLDNTPLAVGPLDPVWHIQGTGDFNGDGSDDILLRQISANPNENGAFFLWQMDGNVIEAQGGIERPPTAWKTLGIGDFDGDGKDDFAVRNVSATGDNGAVWVYLMDGTTIKAQGAAGIANAADFELQMIGDLNGDGKDDILYRNDAGFFYSWNMNGTTLLNEGLLQGNAQWAPPELELVRPLWDVV